MKVRLSVALALFASAAALAACGGGGGGGSFTNIPTTAPSSSSQPTSTPTAPASGATATPAPVGGATKIDQMPSGSTVYGQMTQTQQATAVASLTGTVGSINNLFGTDASVFATRRVIQNAAARRFAATPQCSSADTTSTSTTNSSSGLVTYVVLGYPTGDSECSGSPEYQLQLAVAQPSGKSGPTAGYVGNGFEVFYSSKGVILGENTIGYVSINGSNLQIQGEFVTPLDTVSSVYGVKCNSAGCSAGSVVNFAVDTAKYPSIAFGTVVDTATDSSPTITACANYPGDLGLKYAGASALPYYTITGCATSDNVQISQTGDNAYSIIDSTAGAEVDVTTNDSGSINGVVYAYSNGAKSTQLAEITADQYGNGTLTTSDGTVTPLADFMVI